MIGTNSDPAWGSYSDTTSADGTAIRVWTPRAGTDKWVLWGHPHVQNQQILPGYWAYSFVHSLVNAGFGVVASAQAGLETWGNVAALNATRSAYDWIVTNFGAPAHVIHGAGSMGGLPAMLTAAGQVVTIPNLKGVFLMDGVTNLANMYNATYAGSIRNAYVIASDDSDYAAKTSGHDPNLKTATQFPAIRYRFYASASDAAVSKAQNADLMTTKLTGRALEVATVTKLGGHLSPVNVDPKDVVAFALRCVA